MATVEELIQSYAHTVQHLAAQDSTTENTYYPSVKTLLDGIVELCELPFELRVNTSEQSISGGTDLPDFAFYDGRGEYLVVPGELKTPSALSLTECAMSESRNNQIGRYLQQTGVVIVSNVRGFALVTETADDRAHPVPSNRRRIEQRIEFWSTPEAFLAQQAPDLRHAHALLELIETALTRYAAIFEPESLAKVLARQARFAKAQLPGHFSQAIQGLAEDFQRALGVSFPDDEGQEFFRSSLIQTVFYGVFAGWTVWHRRGETEPFHWQDLTEYLPIPFLGELFYEFQHPRRIQELGLRPHLDIAIETLSRVDTHTFFSRFSAPDLANANSSLNAIMYFYEPFLEAFDPVLRKELGVWYTPPDIVAYQVDKVEQLLRSEFGCERGFADERVVVLDPACGTGAYLLQVVRRIAAQLIAEHSDSLIATNILSAVQHRVIGFELLTAPFVIAHLQIYLLLAELGIPTSREERPAVFLTNSLTGWEGRPQPPLNFPELQEEFDAATSVKEHARIIVVLGNPPYNRFAGVPMEEELGLADHYKGITRNQQGKQIGPSQLFVRFRVRKQLLDDLYVRFFRLAESCIGERADYGIVSFISNYSYLAGRSHPLMRESLLRSFDSIWIDSLNGDKYKTGKVIPRGLPGEGTTDQSIFTTDTDPRGIQVGTAITTLLKSTHHEDATARVFYRDFWGRASDKRAALRLSTRLSELSTNEQNALSSTPAGPRLYEEFSPLETNRWKMRPFSMSGGYEDWPAVDEIFAVWFQGVNPNRGLVGTVIDFERNNLRARMRAYFSDTEDEALRREYSGFYRHYARYDPEDVRAELLRDSGFAAERIVPITFSLSTFAGSITRPEPNC